MYDAQIREALLKYIPHDLLPREQITLVEELGICRGDSRVDIAAFTEKAFYGFEIKGSKDRVERLYTQVKNYNEVFDYNYLVTSEVHLGEAKSIIPNWWGIIVATEGNKGVQLDMLREGSANSTVNLLEISRLFWKDEAIELLQKSTDRTDLSRLNRQLLWSMIAETISSPVIRSSFEEAIKNRQGWREDQLST